MKRVLLLAVLLFPLSAEVRAASCGGYSVSPGPSTGLILFTTTFTIDSLMDLTQPAACYLAGGPNDGPIVQIGTFTYSVTSFMGFANTCPPQTFTFTNFLGGSVTYVSGGSGCGGSGCTAGCSSSSPPPPPPPPPPPFPPADPVWGLGPAGGPSNPQGCCRDPVSTGNGNYYYSLTDLSVSNYIRDLPLEFKRSYNSLETNGRNWTHNLNIMLGSVTINGFPAIAVRWGDGHYEVYFPKAGGFVPLGPATGSLTNDPTTGNYTLTRKDGVKYLFTSTGYLSSIHNRNGQALTLTRDANNNLLTVSDGQQQLSFGYGSNLLLSTVTDLSGRTVSYGYDANGNLTSETDPAGNITQYSYDSLRNLASVTLPNGVVQVQNTYGPYGAVVSQTNADGFTTTFSYASPPGTGPTTITDPLGNVTVHNYPAPGTSLTAIQSIVDPLGHKTSFTYGQTVTYSYTGNAYNQFGGTFACPPVCGIKGYFTVAAPLPPNQNFYFTPISFKFTDGLTIFTPANTTNPAFGVVTDSSGNIVGWNMQWLTPTDEMFSGTNPPGCVGCSVVDGSFNPNAYAKILGSPGTWTVSVGNALNNVTSVTDPNGHTSNFTYDLVGNLLTNTDSLGNTTTFTYNSFSEPLTIKTPRGNTTSLSYDAKGNLLTVADPLGDTTALTYDTAGRLLTVTDPRGNTTSFAYGTCSFCVSTSTDPIGNVTSFAYDPLNRPVSSTDANKHTSSVTYDALSRVTSFADALGDKTLFAYDSIGHLTSITDANSQPTSYSYDPAGNLISVTNAAGNTTKYAYAKNNNLISLTNANGKVTSYSYDAANRLSSVADPLSFVTSYVYDAVGNTLTLADAKGQMTRFTYDAANRRVGVSYADGSAVSYVYDPDGNRMSMLDSHGTSSYSYDPLDRIISVQDPSSGVVAYAYDQVGDRSKVTYPDGKTLSYTYDPDNRLIKATDWLARTTTYSQDAVGNLIGALYPNTASVGFAYDSANRLVKVSNSYVGSTNLPLNPVTSFSYVLDPVGNRVQVTDGSGAITLSGYDALNELTSVNSGGRITGYTYDAVGNRTSMAAPGMMVNYSYDAADRLLSAGATTFTYDANGNQISSTGSTASETLYSYDTANRLVSATVGGTTSSFAYDGDGNRISQSVGSGVYNYVNDVAARLPVVIQESGPDGNISYAYGTGLISESSPTFDYFYQYDGLGSVVGVTNASGHLATRYSYDAWGQAGHTIPRSKVGTQNKFGFAGEALDPGTGLYFMRARYYDPATGRFLSRDPFPGFAADPITLHHYIYARNNPQRFVDPSGKFIPVVIGIGLEIVEFCALDPEVCAAPIVWLLEQTTNSTTGMPPNNNPADLTLFMLDQAKEAVDRFEPSCVPFGTAGHGSRPAGELQ